MAGDPYSLEDLQELQSRPIFLSQFLQLPLPPIRTLAPTPGPPRGEDVSGGAAPGARPYLSRDPSHSNRAFWGSFSAASSSAPTSLQATLSPALILSAWSAFLPSVRAALASLQGSEHILPPPAFRPADLPVATMLPTVYLWCIVAVWQPTLRLFELDEFIEGGASQSEPESAPRRELKVGDHLPEHEALPWAGDALPRQVFYTVVPQSAVAAASLPKGEKRATTAVHAQLVPPSREEDAARRGIKALVSVEEPWHVDLASLASGQGGATLAQTQEGIQALASGQNGATSASASPALQALYALLTSMQTSGVEHGVLTTYEQWRFLRVSFGDSAGPRRNIVSVEISPCVHSSDVVAGGSTSTVFAAMWYFGQVIMRGQ